MTKPHKHAALIKQWADDTTQPIWYWDGTVWQPDDAPMSGYKSYAIGPKPTQPPRKMCSLGGLEFPAPETEAPQDGADIWTAYVDGEPTVGYWQSHSDGCQLCLTSGLVHLTQQAAEQHSRALLAANKQAILAAR